MNSYESRAIRLVAQMLEEQIAEKVGNIAQGALPTFDAYRYSCGYLKALQDVQEFLAELDRDMREGK